MVSLRNAAAAIGVASLRSPVFGLDGGKRRFDPMDCGQGNAKVDYFYSGNDSTASRRPAFEIEVTP